MALCLRKLYIEYMPGEKRPEFSWQLFTQFTEGQVRLAKNVGEVTVNEIKEQLAGRGLKLKDG